MGIPLKLKLIPSGDGKPRYRVVWQNRKFSYFALPHELRQLAREILSLIKDEPNVLRHLGQSGGENFPGKTRGIPARPEKESPEVNSKPNP